MNTVVERLSTALENRYRVERQVGAGGMATVFLAHDLRHDRKVAIKVLREELSAALGKERFLREIRIAAAIQHPHVLPLYDSGDAGGLLFYVMPFVEGMSLRDRLLEQGELTVNEAVRILCDVADALGAAHQQDIVHRDLKPENVMLSGRHALVTDFGVAKALSEATGTKSHTTLGMAIGTPAYMAPEQATADPNVDHRADIYAFGVLAYELLTGRPPFTDMPPQQILAAHVTSVAEPILTQRANIPPALGQLVMKCLEKRPADRFQHADELLPQLEAVMTPSGGSMPTSARLVAAAPQRSRAKLLSLVGTVALVLVTATAAWLSKRVVAVHSDITAADAPSLAVLPFIELNAPAGEEFFAEGLTDEVIVALSTIPGLRVPGRESSLRFRGSEAPISAIADSLDVSMLLTANVQRFDGQVRVRAQLINAEDGVQVWAAAITRPSKDVFSVYDSVAQAISGALALRLTSTPSGRSARREVHPVAYQTYLQGKALLSNRRIDSALTYLARAVAMDSMHAESWAALALAHSVSGPSDYNLVAPETAVENARRAAARAIALDSSSADVWTAVGRIERLQHHWDAGRVAFERALRLNPAHVQALYFSAVGLASHGRHSEAVRRMRQAESAEPLSFMVGTWGAIIAWNAGLHKEALAQSERLLELHPGNERVHRDAALLYVRAGNWTRAAAIFEKRVLLLTGDPATARSIRERLLKPETRVLGIREMEPTLHMTAADLFMYAGGRTDAIRAMRARPVKPGEFTEVFAVWITHPELRRTPEFRAILESAGLPAPAATSH